MLLITSASFSVTHAEAPAKRPKPERFAKEIAKFKAQDKTKAPRKGGIVFTGSSSVRLWDVKKAFPDLPVLNRGFGGSIANDLTVYADQVALRYEPKILVVYTGSNDINAKLSPEVVLADYTKFLKLVHRESPKTVIIVNSVKISRSRLKQMPDVERVNDLLEAWCAERDWTRWVNSHEYLKDAKGQPRDEFFVKDLLHLNEKGYAKWNAIIGPVLHEEWAKPARYGRFISKNPWSKSHL
jgi:lysophospholipase L1-like esterase